MSDVDDYKLERSRRVQARYDELTAEGKHGHYETMFRVVREEVERERTRILDSVYREFGNNPATNDFRQRHERF